MTRGIVSRQIAYRNPEGLPKASRRKTEYHTLCSGHVSQTLVHGLRQVVQPVFHGLLVQRSIDFQT